jgi:hypothetical protein
VPVIVRVVSEEGAGRCQVPGVPIMVGQSARRRKGRHKILAGSKAARVEWRLHERYPVAWQERSDDMRRIGMAGVAGLVTAALWLHQPACAADPPTKPDPAKTQDTLRQLTLDLREAKGLTAGIQDKKVRARMEDLIAQMEKRCDDLQKQVAGLNPTPARTPVNDAELARFVKALQAEAFDDKKLPLLKDYARGNYFSSAQAAMLVKQFVFGKGQGEAAILLHPRLVDPANFYQVLGVFTFDADKDKVRQALGLK